MDYKQSISSMSSYTPRRKDNKYEAYGGLQLKTRTVDEDSQSSQPNDRARRQSFNQDSDSYQGESRGLTKRRESMREPREPREPREQREQQAYMNKYSFDGRDEQEDRRGDDRENMRDQRKDIREQYTREVPDRPEQQEYKRGSYLNIKRNETILREANKDRAPLNPIQDRQNLPKRLDPQLVQKLNSISKLNSRISERLKNMSLMFDKHRS